LVLGLCFAPWLSAACFDTCKEASLPDPDPLWRCLLLLSMLLDMAGGAVLQPSVVLRSLTTTRLDPSGATITAAWGGSMTY
jgi:hypothetical protein